MHSTILARRKADAMSAIAQTLEIDLATVKKVHGRPEVTDLLRLEAIAKSLESIVLDIDNFDSMATEVSLGLGGETEMVELPEGFTLLDDESFDSLKDEIVSQTREIILDKIKNLDVVGKATIDKVLKALSVVTE